MESGQRGTREARAWHRSYPCRCSAAVQLKVSLRVPGRLTRAGPGTDTPPAGGEHEARLVPAGLCLSHMDGRAGTAACCDPLEPGRRAVCPSHTVRSWKPALPNPGSCVSHGRPDSRRWSPSMLVWGPGCARGAESSQGPSALLWGTWSAHTGLPRALGWNPDCSS